MEYVRYLLGLSLQTANCGSSSTYQAAQEAGQHPSGTISFTYCMSYSLYIAI